WGWADYSGGIDGTQGLLPVTNALGDFLRREPQLFGDALVRRRRAEAIDADDQRVVVDVLVPAVGAARFDADDAAAIRQDLVAIRRVLAIEQIERRRRHHAHARSLAFQQLGRLHGQRHLGTGSDDRDVA